MLKEETKQPIFPFFDEVLSLSEISKKTNLSIKILRREVASGYLKRVKSSRTIKIYRTHFLAWYQNFKNEKKTKSMKNNSNKKDEVNWLDISEKMKKIDAWKNPKHLTEFNMIDLFSGAGGLSCGLVMAGFNPVASVEIMPEAVETYNYNFNKQKKLHNITESKDIRNPEVKENLFKQIKNKHIHLIAGGFPCQGFSMAGNRIVDDERNSLYKEMLKIVEKIQPDFILMENVDGLRTMLSGKIEQKIIDDYKKIGYNINVTTLNSADYGVPQIRKRVIFIGNKKGLTNFHPQPIYNQENYKTVAQALEPYLYCEENKSINHIFTKHNEKTKKALEQIEEGQSLYGNYSDAWKKVYWHKPSCTVKENHGGVNVHPIHNRCMTPRELATLQSFPTDFIFKGAKKWQLVQIGNAVPPLLGKAIGICINHSLTQKLKMEYSQSLSHIKTEINKYLSEIFKVYGNELLLRLEEYNLLSNLNNCIEASTATGYIMEEFVISKLGVYSQNHKSPKIVISKDILTNNQKSFDCYCKFNNILTMINIKTEKEGSNNNAVAAINRLYKDYVVDKSYKEKSYLILKIKYKFDFSRIDNQRKIIVLDIDSYFLEEVDFSQEYKQDSRNWSQKLNKNSGRLQISDKFRKEHCIDISCVSHIKTKEMIKTIFKNNTD